MLRVGLLDSVTDLNQVSFLTSSVPDPDPDPDPYGSVINWPPGSGSGSVIQTYVSGSGSGSGSLLIYQKIEEISVKMIRFDI